METLMTDETGEFIRVAILWVTEKSIG